MIGGERTKLQVAHIKLSHSRAFLVRAYLLQTHEITRFGVRFLALSAHWPTLRSQRLCLRIGKR